MTSTTAPAKPDAITDDKPGRWGTWWRHQLLVGAIVAIVAAVVGLSVPSVLNAYYTGLALSGVILAMLAIGIGFLSRHLGLISLGHAAIFGSAAYGLAIANTRWHWAPLPAALFGILAGVVVAMIMAALVVRATGMGFLMLTLALGQALYSLTVLSDARPYTGAYDGLSLVFQSNQSFLGVNSVDLFNANDFWPVAWIALVLSAFLLWSVGRTHFGTVLHGIRENEERMRFSGFNTYAPRFLAFVLSGVIAAVGGVLFGLNAGTITPDIMGFDNAGQSLVASIVGGLGTVLGPIIGALLYVYAQSKFSTSGNLELYTGIALILALAFLRGGITGSIALGARKLLAFRKRKEQP